MQNLSIVKPSDKCKGLVLLNREDYVSKAQTITSSNETLKTSPTRRTEAANKLFIKDFLKGKMDERTTTALFHRAPGQLSSGLHEDHKPDIPLRTIVSACGVPLTWLLILAPRSPGS